MKRSHRVNLSPVENRASAVIAHASVQRVAALLVGELGEVVGPYSSPSSSKVLTHSSIVYYIMSQAGPALLSLRPELKYWQFERRNTLAAKRPLAWISV